MLSAANADVAPPLVAAVVVADDIVGPDEVRMKMKWIDVVE